MLAMMSINGKVVALLFTIPLDLVIVPKSQALSIAHEVFCKMTLTVSPPLWTLHSSHTECVFSKNTLFTKKTNSERLSLRILLSAVFPPVPQSVSLFLSDPLTLCEPDCHHFVCVCV